MPFRLPASAVSQTNGDTYDDYWNFYLDRIEFRAIGDPCISYFGTCILELYINNFIEIIIILVIL